MDTEKTLQALSTEEKITLLTGYDGFSAVNLPQKQLFGIKMADGPYGVKTPDGNTVCYPNTCLMACSWDKDVCRIIGEMLGEDCRNNNVEVLLSPAINIKRNPLCGRNFEYYSEDPVLTGILVLNYVKGLKKHGVAVCLKHFACNNQENNRWTYNSVVDDDTLRNIYLKAFETVIKALPIDMVMACYNKINGVYGCENSYLLQDILRKEWGFDGVVVSDWCAVSDLTESYKNGLDLEMPSNAHITVPELKKAYKNGEITEETLNEKARRLLKLYAYVKQEDSCKNDCFSEEEKQRVLRKITGECFVLLKNERNLLPFAENEKILLVGNGALRCKIQGGGCANMKTDKTTSPYEEIKKYCPDCDVINGYDLLDKDVSKYDKVVIFLELPDGFDSESIDRADGNFPKEQLDCLYAICDKNANVAAVLFNGGAVNLDFEPKVKAILETYYPGSYGGGAIADVLFGKTNPCGKLAETFPKSFKDVPSLKDSSFGDDIVYREGEFVGYRYYTTFDVKTKYPFGYGLSYSLFATDNVRITRKEERSFDVSLDVVNKSDIDGKYTLQVYLKSEDGFIPKMQLLNFITVRINAGEKKNLNLTLDEECFKRYVNGKKKKIKGKYSVCVAESSENIIYEKEFLFNGIKKKAFTKQTLLGTLLCDARYRDITFKYMKTAILDWAFGSKADDNADFEKDVFLKNSVYNMPIRAFTYFGNGDFDCVKEEQLLLELNAT